MTHPEHNVKSSGYYLIHFDRGRRNGHVPEAHWKSQLVCFRVIPPGPGPAKKIDSVTTVQEVRSSQGHQRFLPIATHSISIHDEEWVHFDLRVDSDEVDCHFLAQPRVHGKIKIDVLLKPDKRKFSGEVPVDIEAPPVHIHGPHLAWYEKNIHKFDLRTSAEDGEEFELGLYKYEPRMGGGEYHLRHDETLLIKNETNYGDPKWQKFVHNKFTITSVTNRGFKFKSHRVVIGKELLQDVGRIEIKRDPSNGKAQHHHLLVNYRPAKEATIEATVTLEDVEGEKIECPPVEAKVNGEKVDLSFPALPPGVKASVVWKIVDGPDRIRENTAGFQLIPSIPQPLYTQMSAKGVNCPVTRIELVKNPLTEGDPVELPVRYPCFIRGLKIELKKETRIEVDTAAAISGPYDVHVKDYNLKTHVWDDLAERQEFLEFTPTSPSDLLEVEKSSPQEYRLKTSRAVVGAADNPLFKDAGRLTIARASGEDRQVPRNNPVQAIIDLLPISHAVIQVDVYLQGQPGDPNTPYASQKVTVTGERVLLYCPGLPPATNGRLVWRVPREQSTAFTTREGFQFESATAVLGTVTDPSGRSCPGVTIAIAHSPLTEGPPVSISVPPLPVHNCALRIEKPGFQPVAKEVTFTDRGNWTVTVTAAEASQRPIHDAVVTAGSYPVTANGPGRYQIAVEAGGAGGTLDAVAMTLDEGSRNVQQRVKQGLQRTIEPPDAPESMKAAVRRIEQFMDKEFVDRLADEPRAEYESTIQNVTTFAAIALCQQTTLELLTERIDRVIGDLKNFLGNLVKVFLNLLLAGKLPGQQKAGAWIKGGLAKMAGKLVEAVRAVFQWAGRTLTSFPRTRHLLQSGVSLLKSGIAILDDWLDRLRISIQMRHGGGGAPIPPSVSQHIPPVNDVGPFGDPRAARQAFEAATDAEATVLTSITQTQGLLSRFSKQLTKAQQKLNNLTSAISTHQRTVTRLEQDLANLAPGSAQAAKLQRDLDKVRRKLSDAMGNSTQAQADVTRLTGLVQENTGQLSILQQSLTDVRASLGTAAEAFSTILGVLNRGVTLLQLGLLRILGFGMSLLGPVVKTACDAYFRFRRAPSPGSPPSAPSPHLELNVNPLVDTATTCATEIVTGAIADAAGEGGSDLAASSIRTRLRKMEFASASAVLDASVDIVSRWEVRDQSTLRDATQFQFHMLNVARDTQVSEVWTDGIANVLNDLSTIIVWTERLLNLVLGLISILAGLFTFGGGTGVVWAARLAVTEAIEFFDNVWDIIKAVATGFRTVLTIAQLTPLIGAVSQFAGIAFNNQNILNRGAQAGQAAARSQP